MQHQPMGVENDIGRRVSYKGRDQTHTVFNVQNERESRRFEDVQQLVEAVQRDEGLRHSSPARVALSDLMVLPNQRAVELEDIPRHSLALVPLSMCRKSLSERPEIGRVQRIVAQRQTKAPNRFDAARVRDQIEDAIPHLNVGRYWFLPHRECEELLGFLPFIL